MAAASTTSSTRRPDAQVRRFFAPLGRVSRLGGFAMAGRAMIVGRSRSHIVGAVPRHGYAGDYAELMEFTGAYGTPSIVGAEAPAPPPPPEHHPDYSHHSQHPHY